MKLKIVLPSELLIEKDVTKVIAEAWNGSFCLLPRHIDFVAALVPGLLSFETRQGGEEFVAVDEGILVKCASEVLISTKNAVYGPDLGHLKEAVQKRFIALKDREKMSHSALAKLEANFVRRFLELEKYGR
ncbi:MAG: F0F1 ATP synthase subunit epsilon [Desulfobacterales bacterium]|nr:F0F1 ATP synthase subunit epsilon [Desulfobacterales bacterium]